MSEVKSEYTMFLNAVQLNNQQRQKIDYNYQIAIKVFNIMELIKRVQEYKDGAITSQLEVPEQFQYYRDVEMYWQKVIDRLANYLNNTVSEIHL